MTGQSQRSWLAVCTSIQALKTQVRGKQEKLNPYAPSPPSSFSILSPLFRTLLFHTMHYSPSERERGPCHAAKRLDPEKEGEEFKDKTDAAGDSLLDGQW